MSELRIRAVEATGTAKPKAWSQAHVATDHSRQVVVLVSLLYSGEGELVDLAQIGTDLLESLIKKGEITGKEIGEIGDGIEINIVVGNYSTEGLVVSGVGEVEVFIERGGKTGLLLAGKEIVTKSVGSLLPGDRLLITTKAFGKLLTTEGIKGVLMGGLPEIEKLAVLMHGSEDSSRMAVVMAELEELESALENDSTTIKYEKSLKLGDWKDNLSRVITKIWNKPLLIQEEKRRWNAAIGMVLIVLLVTGVLGGMVRKSKLVKERAYTQLESSIDQKMQEATSIADLNPERAKLLLAQGNNEIVQYLTETKDEAYRVKADGLSKQMKKIEEDIFRKQQVNLNVLTELSLITKNLKTEKMTLDANGNLLLPDLNAPQIGVVNLVDKSNLVMDLGELGKAKELATYNKKTFGVVDRGVFAISGNDKKLVIEPDELWKEVTLIDVFGGNVYLLDRGQSEIWKYPVLTDGFGTRRRWLGAGIQLDLSNVVDMKVDGDIWLLTSSGKLEKFSRGVPTDFSMEGFPAVADDKLQAPTAVFLTDDKVYVLESGAERVVVFNKESGKYERQYAATDLKEGTDLVVYENKAYVLVQDKIVWFQL